MKVQTLIPYSIEQLFESSAKCIHVKKLLAEFKAQGSRVLLFSQMTKYAVILRLLHSTHHFHRVLDILELYLSHLGYSFVRLDGQTPVNTRQDIIDKYNKEKVSCIVSTSYVLIIQRLNFTEHFCISSFNKSWWTWHQLDFRRCGDFLRYFFQSSSGQTGMSF
jgi:hypothetical protein